MTESSTALLTRHVRLLAGQSGGERLPSSRQLVAEFGVSPVTVRRVVAALEREGLVETRAGVGTFAARRTVDVVAADQSWQLEALGAARSSGQDLLTIVEPPAAGMLVLSAGYPSPDLLPVSALTTAAVRAARRPSSWGRVPASGLTDLRAWFAHDLGGGLTAEELMIAPGGQSALAVTLRALTVPGDVLLLEAPTYPGVLAIARSAGLEVVPVAGDRDGPVPERLAERFATTGSRLLYAQPTHANPTGRTWPAARRREVLEVVRAAGAFVIEDDWADRTTIEGTVPAPLVRSDGDGHVVYVRGLSKALGPGIRVAGVAARGPALRRLRNARVIDDLFVSGVLQETALEVMVSSAWERHLRGLRRTLGERRDALVTAVRTQLGDGALDVVPTGGFHLWVRVPVESRALAARAAAAGVVVSPGEPWFPTEPTGDFLRLSFTGADVAALTDGVRRLAELL